MKIRWTHRARADLNNTFEYIFPENPKAALKIVDSIEAMTAHLVHHPEMGRKGRVATTRELIIPQTPYIVVYRIKLGSVDIIAVLHSARKWPERL